MSTLSPTIEYASWNAWDPKAYLTEYYASVMPDEQYALEFLVESIQALPPVDFALDFGSGPTVHHLFALIPRVREIHTAEYLASNRDEIQAWLDAHPDAHDWSEFAGATLRLEGIAEPSPQEIEERQQAVRERLTRIWPADAGEEDPLGREKRASYSLVTTHYCAEGATNSKETWRLYMRNISSLVKPGGSLLLSACGAADFYCVGPNLFPCAGVNSKEVIFSLEENGFRNMDIRVRAVPDHTEQGYSSVIFARATKAE